MKGSLYSKFTNKKLALGEHLAAAQAILANERTYLAFIGAIGIVFIPAGIFTWAFGHLKYRKMKALIHDIEHNNGD